MVTESRDQLLRTQSSYHQDRGSRCSSMGRLHPSGRLPCRPQGSALLVSCMLWICHATDVDADQFPLFEHVMDWVICHEAEICAAWLWFVSLGLEFVSMKVKIDLLTPELECMPTLWSAEEAVSAIAW